MPSLSLPTTALEDALETGIARAEIADRLEIMREQEETTYRVFDYLVQNASMLKHSSKPVDADCRIKMCEWCYQVVDFCKFRRETVGIGMSYLDRYLTTSKGRKALSQRKEYQLSAMTALYIAIKIHEPLEMETSLLADLSRGCYNEMEFVAMEQIMLEALEWRVSGPTALGFVQLFLALLLESVHHAVVSAIMDYTRYQIELATSDHSFVDCLPSEIALAAILNAMEGMDVVLLPLELQSKFMRSIERYSGLLVDQVEPLQAGLSVLMMNLIADDAKIIEEYFDSDDEDAAGGAHEESSVTSSIRSGNKSRRHSPVSVARKNSSSHSPENNNELMQ